MRVTYKNFRGETYYLQKGTGKEGRTRYFFSKKEAGKPVKSIPEGYEIYEDPNGRVFLKKIVPKKITQEDVSVVENSIRQYAKARDYKIDVKGKAITVYLPDQNIEGLTRLLGPSDSILRPLLEKSLKNLLTYSPVMRFVLIDEKERNFHVERAEFVEEGWYFLEGAKDLQKLAKKYCHHLGRDSLYELL